jgi:hypothetical protein
VTGFIKRMACLLVAGMVALALLASPVYANPFGARHGPDGNRQGGQGGQGGGRYQPYAPAPRDVPRPDERRYGGRDEPRPQRFSPDERRQLRRDIQDAGREIYTPRR